MPTVIRLPPEILIAIIPFLELEDVKSIRQCSKLLAHEGSRPLFETLIVYCTISSFATLRAVARHKEFRLHVRQIIYVANRYVPNMNLAQWRHHYSNGSRGNFGTAVWLGKPFDTYQSISSEQEGLVNDGRAANIWTASLPCLPGLIDFRIALREAQKPDQGLLHSMINRTFCEPDGDFESAELIENTKTVIQVQSIFTRLAHLHMCSSGSSPAAPKLRVLHLEGVSARLISNLAELCSMGLSSCLSNLRTLCIQFVVSKHDWDLDPEAAKAVGKIMGTAPSLTDVEVSILGQHFRLGLEDIFIEESSWPTLRRVKLHGIAFKCQGLRQFIERFRSNLRTLTISLSDERFEEPTSWQQCVDQLAGSYKSPVGAASATVAEMDEILEGAMITYCPEKDGPGFVAQWT